MKPQEIGRKDALCAMHSFLTLKNDFIHHIGVLVINYTNPQIHKTCKLQHQNFTNEDGDSLGTKKILIPQAKPLWKRP